MTTSKAMAKVAAVAAGLAMATSMLSLAPIAHAASYTFTRSLTVGSTGADVTALQQALIAAGYSIPAGATGYFGAQTQSAVAKWQVAANVSPAAGYFGPISQAAWSSWAGGMTTGGSTSMVPGCAAGAMFSATTGQSCTSSTSSVAGCAPGAMFSATTGQSCSGSTTTTTGGTGVGYLTQVTSLGDISSTLYAGGAPVAVAGFSAHATNGNVTLQRVQANITVCGTGSVTPTTVAVCNGTIGSASLTSQSVNLNRYVSDISLWNGTTEIADVNPSTAGSLTGRTWTILFPGLSSVIPANTTSNFHIQVTPISSIGTNENGQSVVVEIPTNGIYAVGSDGIQGTYGSVIDQPFTVSSAITGSVTVSTASDNPNASLVAVSSSTTTGVKLLAFNVQAKNSPLTITTLNASVGVNTGSTNVSNVLNTLYLENSSGTVIASKTGSSGTYNALSFQNLSLAVPQGTTQEFWLVADIKGDQTFADGATIVASTSASGWTITDANGATVTVPSAAAGNTQTLSASGINVALGTPTAVNVPSNGGAGTKDVGNYSIPFTITAGSNDIFINGATGTGIVYATTTSSGSNVTTQPAANLSVGTQVGGSTNGDSGTIYRIPANTARTFTLNVTYTASTTGFTGLQLVSIAYGTTVGSQPSTYTSNLTTFKTNDINLTAH